MVFVAIGGSIAFIIDGGVVGVLSIVYVALFFANQVVGEPLRFVTQWAPKMKLLQSPIVAGILFPVLWYGPPGQGYSWDPPPKPHPCPLAVEKILCVVVLVNLVLYIAGIISIGWMVILGELQI